MPRAKKSEPDPNSLGGRIRIAYLRKGLNRKQFAEAIGGKYYHQVVNWEDGKAVPKLAQLMQIADVLDVTETWLMRGTGSYHIEFLQWLADEAPPSLLDHERETLAAIRFPQPHPGPIWYTSALSAWRLSAQAKIAAAEPVERTHVRRVER